MTSGWPLHWRTLKIGLKASYFFNPTKNLRRVAILIDNNLNVTPIETVKSTDEIFILIEANFKGSLAIFGAIYGPNIALTGYYGIGKSQLSRTQPGISEM